MYGATLVQPVLTRRMMLCVGVYGALPEAVKLVLFLEWPLYARDGSDDQGPYSAVQ